MKKFAAIALLAVFAINAESALASFGFFGFIGEDGTNLVQFDPGKKGETPPTLDQVPAIPNYDNPRGIGSIYYGTGQTHGGNPTYPFEGTPTDIGLRITNILHNGNPVNDGFRIDSGELGAFEDINVFQIPPTNQKGLMEDLLFATATMIEDGQNGGSNHAHIYFDADAPGSWEVTFILRDLGAAPIYGDSDPFTYKFRAVPEPASVGLLLSGVGLIARRRRL